MSEPEEAAAASPPPSGRRAVRIALGILSSRVLGFVRDRFVAHFFGVGAHADVFRLALRGPNLLQNLLGEGTISATFIPVYSRLLRQGREEEAGRLAGAVFGLLLAVAAGLTLIGALLAQPIVALLAPGFLEDAARGAPVDRFALAVTAVRLMFPMAGLLVLAAWALGVLNSHRRFFLPYFAPVFWNAAIIAALVVAGAAATGSAAGRDRLLVAACIGALAGGALQFVVQLPLVLRLMRGFRISFSLRQDAVRETLRGFAPVVAGRGVVQIASLPRRRDGVLPRGRRRRGAGLRSGALRAADLAVRDVGGGGRAARAGGGGRGAPPAARAPGAGRQAGHFLDPAGGGRLPRLRPAPGRGPLPHRELRSRRERAGLSRPRRVQPRSAWRPGCRASWPASSTPLATRARRPGSPACASW